MQINFTNKPVTLKVNFPQEEIMVLANEDRLQQIMMNLLGNALRCTPAGGTVTVSTRESGGMAEISVSDTGIGIPEEHLPHVFERLYRVEDSRSRQDGGSGLGLTIASKLIEAQGGHIRAESDGVNRGTTFVFTLPLAGN
jgi:signal transduction histidine kinase